MPEVAQEVYKAIVAVSADIAKTGIGKSRSNVQQGYKFRGIDDVYNEMAPLLSKHSLCILPRVLNRASVERVSSNNKAIFYITVDMEFDFVSAVDGSKHVVKTCGEAMDSADKATNKAMSAAYKYALFQAFCIPTEGDNDADASTTEVKEGPVLDQSILDAFNMAVTMDELAKAWGTIPVGNRHSYAAAKDEAKARIGGAA
jgi:hypothetical protein